MIQKCRNHVVHTLRRGFRGGALTFSGVSRGVVRGYTPILFLKFLFDVQKITFKAVVTHLSEIYLHLKQPIYAQKYALKIV